MEVIARTILRRESDWPLVLAALLHALALLLWPAWWLIGLGLWWNSNTIAHYFLHQPFFTNRTANRTFALFETLLLGVPQTLWKQRHLAHHAGNEWHFKRNRSLNGELILLSLLWTSLLIWDPNFFAFSYLPGWILGLALCQVQGHYEHHRGTVSHYGRLYNLLFFNDGFHVEHHLRPHEPWSALPALRAGIEHASRWPAVLRWLDNVGLVALEKFVLRFVVLQRWVLASHTKAFRRLLRDRAGLQHIAIVGGGLFPRTAIILRKLFPEAKLTIFEMNPAHIEIARQYLEALEFRAECFDENTPGFWDLLVLPLSFQGPRERVLAGGKARTVLSHDWFWNGRGGEGTLISPWLLKRLNAIDASGQAAKAGFSRSHPVLSVQPSKAILLGVSFWIVAVIAKSLALWDRLPALGPSNIIQLIWQDGAAAILLAMLAALPWRAAAFFAYATFSAFLILNLPLQRALSSPITFNMLHAAGRTLSDSIGHYLTLGNGLMVAALSVTAAIVPSSLKRFRSRSLNAPLSALPLSLSSARFFQPNLEAGSATPSLPLPNQGLAISNLKMRSPSGARPPTPASPAKICMPFLE